MCSTHPTPPARRRGAIHDQGVELDFAFAIEETSAAGVESLVIFHYDDRCFGGVERGAAFLKHAPSGGDSIPDAVQVCLNHIIRNSPGAAVDEKNRIAHGDPRENWSV